jgi:myo-inositol-1(or 4)-monophosphatase
MKGFSFSAELEAARKAAESASEIALSYLNRDKGIKHKGLTDLVTIADVECEKRIKEMLSREFPDYGFLGEETGSGKDSDFMWVVDPIDGTNNFASNLPIFCHSIALVKGGKPLLGLVYLPVTGQFYFAEKGKGAYMDGSEIRVSEKSKLADCLIGMGFPYAADARREKTVKSVSNLVGKVLGIRRTGSAVIDLCYLASGYFGGVFFYELQPWDVAASMLLVQEAGGIVTDINGRKTDIFAGNFAASNNRVHKEFLSYLEAFDG